MSKNNVHKYRYSFMFIGNDSEVLICIHFPTPALIKNKQIANALL